MSPSSQSTSHRRPSAGLLAAVGILVLLAAVPLRAQTAAAAPSRMPPLAFDLKDQFDREYTQAYCAGKIGLVIEADREGSKFSGPWGQAIGRELTPEVGAVVQWVSVAALPSMPGFMRGFVEGKFSQDKAKWVLLDWGGTIAKTYKVPSGCCNVLLFGPDGRFLARVGGREVDPAGVAAAVAAITAAAAGAAPPAAGNQP